MSTNGHAGNLESQIDAARHEITAAARALVEAGVLSPSEHGNMSARIAGTDLMLLTGVSSLANVTPEGLAVLHLDGRVHSGEVHPASAEIIHMHADVYLKRPDLGGIIHTHSPFSTSFAIANRPLDLVSEALVRFGVEEAIPVAAYAPRGSKEAVSNIIDVVGPKTRAVLLQNHGLLAFGDTVTAAKHLILVMEEAAQAALNAAAIGGATVIPASMLHATRQRAQDFAAQGTLAATDTPR